MNILRATLIAGAGGFIGTCMRFLSEKFGALICHTTFPLGTFLANMLGCFLIGVFYGWAVKSKILSKNMNIFLITGLCGGFTTFSSFSLELVQHLESGEDAMFWIYLGSSIVLGLLLVVLGIACVRTPKGTQPESASV